MIPILDELVSRKERIRMIDDLYNLTPPGKVISESEAMRLDDMFRRSLREEGYEEGIEQGMIRGKEQGIIQGKIDIIQSLLRNNLDSDWISKVTGNSIEEIKKIEESLKD